ncbi:hypothetical protein [Amycolatopsis sp. H20-H5]|uniref:hypothetical protein n=1 Tax=Amycolatopsis sp. H20-H5 TaxID=3046309 RepID=UPI002DBEB721|nr:hypothetical protein [Amycolatopsis sp. H20-H5]MEC3976514.1 hypothetical protein [Amycolatopsis sp. H20-H5]
MDPAEEPDLDQLRAQLRESEETSAKSKQMLEDTEGAELIRDLQEAMAKAILLGRPDIARKTAATLAELQTAEKELRLREELSSAARHEAQTRLSDFQNRD